MILITLLRKDPLYGSAGSALKDAQGRNPPHSFFLYVYDKGVGICKTL